MVTSSFVLMCVVGTTDEIMMISGDKSRSNVSRIIAELCRMGACKRTKNKRRTLRPSYIKFRYIND